MIMKKYSHFRILIRLFGLYAKNAPLNFVATVLLTVAVSIFPALTVIIWEKIFGIVADMSSATTELIIIWLAILMLSLLIEHILINLNNINEFYASEKIKIALLNEIHLIASKVPAAEYESLKYYDSIFRAESIINGRLFLNTIRHIFQLCKETISVVSIAIVLSSYSIWLLFIVFLAVLPSAITRIIRGEKFYYFNYHKTTQKRLLGYLASLLVSPTAIRETRVYGSFGYIFGIWKKNREELNKDEWRFSKKSAIIQIITDGTRILGYVAGIVITIFLVCFGRIDISVFGAVAIALKMAQENFSRLLMRFSALLSGLNSMNDFIAFIDTEPEKHGELQIDEIETIEFKNVTYCYPQAERATLRNISLKIKKGDSIAIVGPNGAGKTTLIKLILGIYRPNSGEILLNGKSIYDYSPESLYKLVSAVFQDYIPYYLSYRENIAMSNLENLNNDEKIIETVTNCGVLSVMEKLTQGLDTNIGTNFGGIDLSGGEWQKTAVARGVFKDAGFLVLDEPTASLDPITEADILNDYIKSLKSKTVILVTHRTGAARLAKRIIVLENGEIKEEGDHKTLLASGGIYANLFNSQAKWYT